MSKHKRDKKKFKNATKAKLKRVVSLSSALMRARAVRNSIVQLKHQAHHQDRESLASATLDAVLTKIHSPQTQQNQLVEVYLGLLYAVVEKWRAWQFTDPIVDSLLLPAAVGQLERFRHAVFHAAIFDDKQYQGADGWIPWAVQLDDAMESALQKLLPEQIAEE